LAAKKNIICGLQTFQDNLLGALSNLLKAVMTLTGISGITGIEKDKFLPLTCRKRQCINETPTISGGSPVHVPGSFRPGNEAI